MDKLISDNFSKDYSVLLHDANMLNLIEFYYYEKDLINDSIIALQYFGKSYSRRKEKYIQHQDMFIFDEKNLYNFVNKLDEFIKTDGYPKNAYLVEAAIANSPTLRLQKKSENEFIISRGNNIDEALDKKYNWSLLITNNQAKQLLDQLTVLKNKILEKSSKQL